MLLVPPLRNLRKHMMWKHVGEQPHSCKQYNFTSTFSDALQIHKMTHTLARSLYVLLKV